jgi:methyl-accepting chemotaxis protein
VNILFRPGLLLLNRLPFGKKFLLLFLIFAFSLASIGSVYIYSLNEKTKFSEKEREGLTYIQWQLQMLKAVQTHQELTFLALNGEQGMEPKIKQTERQIAQLVQKIKDYDQQTKLLTNDKKWKDLQQSLQQIAQIWTAEKIAIDTKSFYEAASSAREKMFAAAGQMVQLLETRIAKKYEQLNAVKWGTIVVIITASLVVLYLFAAFYRSVHQHVTLIEERTLQAAKGDLTVQLHIHTIA